MVIRSTKHTLSFSNREKISVLKDFLAEYRRVASLYGQFIWTHNITWHDGSVLDIQNNRFNFPLYCCESKRIPLCFEHQLSERALSCCLNQVFGLIKAAVRKQAKRVYIYNKTKSLRLLQVIKKKTPSKPRFNTINAELRSVCCDIRREANSFNFFLRLKSLGNFKHLKIPLKHTQASLKYVEWGLKTSVLVTDNYINLRWEKEVGKIADGRTVGADQGLKTVLTLSDAQTTATQDAHGHSIESIVDKLARKRPGSKAFRRAQAHRKNFINWSINRLNLNGIKQVNLEDVVNINYKKRTSAKLRHWTNTEIRNKLISRCELLGVQVVLQSSVYRSQRCSCCGMVRKANRNKKVYECVHCGNRLDADLNAALNHEIDLPTIPVSFTKSKLNRAGFFWKPEGLFSLDGQELRVPDSSFKA